MHIVHPHEDIALLATMTTAQLRTKLFDLRSRFERRPSRDTSQKIAKYEQELLKREEEVL